MRNSSLTLVIGPAKSGMSTALYRRAVAAKNSPTALVHLVDAERDALRMQDMIRSVGGDPDDAGWLLHHRSSGDLAETWLAPKVRPGDTLVIDFAGLFKLHGDVMTFERLSVFARTLQANVIAGFQPMVDVDVAVEVLGPLPGMTRGD